MEVSKHPVQFFTAVCNDWLKLLANNDYKDIIIEALSFRIKQGQVKLGAYVIMPNHIHLIWRIQNNFKLENVQRDFLKFTARAILEKIRKDQGDLKLDSLYVGLKDRQFQIWKRNSMSIDLLSDKFLKQKLKYIHDNPCQPHWNLVSHPLEYRYSSARSTKLVRIHFVL
jgi:Transposase and inactivated derivatives